MNYETVKAVAADLDMWLSLIVNSWIVLAGLIIAIRRPKNIAQLKRLFDWVPPTFAALAVAVLIIFVTTWSNSVMMPTPRLG